MSRTRRRFYRTGRKTLRDGQARSWNWSAPGWWNNLTHTRARRTQERLQVERLMRCPCEADGLNWPLPKKPHKYFW